MFIWKCECVPFVTHTPHQLVAVMHRHIARQLPLKIIIIKRKKVTEIFQLETNTDSRSSMFVLCLY